MLIKITASRSELWFTYSLIVIWIKKYMIFNEFMQNSKTRIKVKHIQSLHNASKIFFFYFAFLQLVRWWIVWRRRNDFDIKLQLLLIINWIVYALARSYDNDHRSTFVLCHFLFDYACWQIWKSNKICPDHMLKWNSAGSALHRHVDAKSYLCMCARTMGKCSLNRARVT